MRIVGGKHRGRELEAGPDKRVRPTADRTREALFNILMHSDTYRTRFGPLPTGIRVLDVFAGTGALGLEALSRGARHAIFLDDHPDSIKLIRLNAGLLKEIPRCTILQRDAQNPGRAPGACQLVLLDAPYERQLTAPAIVALDAQGWIDGNAIVVAELPAKDGPPFPIPAEFTLLDDRTYGAARLVILQRAAKAEEKKE